MSNFIAQLVKLLTIEFIVVVLNPTVIIIKIENWIANKIYLNDFFTLMKQICHDSIIEF